MSWLAAYLHLVFTMFLVGYALYWAIMVVSLRRDFPPAEIDRLLETAQRSRWPHVGVPWRFRLPLPIVGWAFLGVLLVTGLALMAGYGLGTVLALKIALVATFALIQIRLTRRPEPPLIFVSFALVLLIVVLSGLLIRV